MLTYNPFRRGRYDGPAQDTSHRGSSSRDATPTRHDRQPDRTERPAAAAASSGGSYASYKTAEDRAAFIKQQAEQRMAERLAALGLKAPTKPTESPQQRQDRLRQAEEEDSKRDHERQRRLADEQPSVPEVAKATKKPPPAPPVRKNRADSAAQREAKRKEEQQREQAEKEGMEKAIKDQQEAQASETRAME